MELFLTDVMISLELVSTAARTGQGVGRCGHMTNDIHERSMSKIDRRGGGKGGRGSKNPILGNYPKKIGGEGGGGLKDRLL